MNKLIFIYSTFSDLKKAKKIARESIEKKLAICANIIKTDSIYSWQDKINESEEFIILFKTNINKSEDLKNYLNNNHEYKVPVIAELSSFINSEYFNWMNSII